MFKELDKAIDDEICRVIDLISKSISKALDGYIGDFDPNTAVPHKSATEVSSRVMEASELSMVCNVEQKLLRVLRDRKYTKEQLALLLLDPKEIYRTVAEKYLKEIETNVP